MKSKVIFAATALLASSVSFADSYQAEAGVVATRNSENYLGSPTKENSYEVYGKYFLNPVDTSNKPFAEAAYLLKSNDIYANLTVIPSHDGAGTFTVTTLGGELYIPEHFFYVAVQGDKYQCCGSHGYDVNTQIGVTPIDGLRVTTTYNSKIDYRVNLQGKYVTSIGDGRWVNVEAAYADQKGDDLYKIGGDFYLDSTFSLGGAITKVGSDNFYEVRTTKFFSPKLSGSLSYSGYSEDYGHQNVVSASLAVRF